MRLNGLEKITKVYFIGIGGISMSALAKFLTTCGYEVSGSDATRGEETKELAFYGVKVHIGADKNREELLSSDLVVYTDAIDERHEEFVSARTLGKKILSRGELLKLVCENFPHTLAIAGSHGKTTCTSMCAHILKSTGVPFTAHIGGEDSVFGNFYSTGREYFVTEACEYKRNILKIQAERAVLLNIDKDHLECYDSETALIKTFQTYCQNAKTAFVCADSPACRTIGDFPSFGIENPLADYRAVNLRSVDERYSFTIEEYGKAICRIHLKAIGKCNVYNALASFAVSRSFGFDGNEIKRGLENFVAVKRRFEKIGTYHGASFICDYAHHPREIASTIATAKGICKGKLFVVFQPHTYSRTKLLFDDFINVLQDVENLMIYKTYPAREAYDEFGSAKRLAMQIGCLYSENTYALKTWLKRTIGERDTVLFLGAGDIYYLAQYLLSSYN